MRVSPQRRGELLDDFERSGMSSPDFAKLAGIKYQTFAYWLQRRRKSRESSVAGSPAKSGAVQWFEAVAQANVPATGSLLVVRLGSGACMEVGNVAQAALAAALLRALEKLPC